MLAKLPFYRSSGSILLLFLSSRGSSGEKLSLNCIKYQLGNSFGAGVQKLITGKDSCTHCNLNTKEN